MGERGGISASMKSELEKDQSLLPLTSLRFVAAAMIVIHHELGIGTFPLNSAVSFFFVLSGFILAYNYPQLRGSEIKRFIIRRIARIWPVHFVTAIAAAVIIQTLDIKFVANIALVHAWIPIASWYFSYNSPSWTISTEFFFYVAFVFLIYRWSTTFWWKLLGCAAMLWSIMAVSAYLDVPSLSADTMNTVTLNGLLYVGPLARLLEFASGMAASLLYRWLSHRAHLGSVYTFTALEVLSLALAGYVMETQCIYQAMMQILPPTSPEYLAHAGSWPAFIPIVLVFALRRGFISKLLSAKVLVILGEASYSLYLVHQLVFIVIVLRWMPAGWLTFIVGAIISQALALALLFLVENPVRRYVKRLLARDRRPLHGTNSRAIEPARQRSPIS